MRDQFTSDGIVLDNALAFWVHRVYQALRVRTLHEFRAHGEEITPEQWIVLVRLWEQDGRSQSELGAAIHRDRPTTSRLVDGMERRGLLARRADAAHGRIQRVHLTARGKRLRTKLIPVARDLVARLVAGVSESDLEITRRTLQRLFDNLEPGQPEG